MLRSYAVCGLKLSAPMNCYYYSLHQRVALKNKNLTVLRSLFLSAGQKIPGVYARPVTRAQKLENLQLCMSFMGNRNINLQGIYVGGTLYFIYGVAIFYLEDCVYLICWAGFQRNSWVKWAINKNCLFAKLIYSVSTYPHFYAVLSLKVIIVQREQSNFTISIYN